VFRETKKTCETGNPKCGPGVGEPHYVYGVRFYKFKQDGIANKLILAQILLIYFKNPTGSS
jgi:hypothetical protein